MFRYFKTSPVIACLTVIICVRRQLSRRNVERLRSKDTRAAGRTAWRQLCAAGSMPGQGAFRNRVVSTGSPEKCACSIVQYVDDRIQSVGGGLQHPANTIRDVFGYLRSTVSNENCDFVQAIGSLIRFLLRIFFRAVDEECASSHLWDRSLTPLGFGRSARPVSLTGAGSGPVFFRRPFCQFQAGNIISGL